MYPVYVFHVNGYLHIVDKLEVAVHSFYVRNSQLYELLCMKQISNN